MHFELATKVDFLSCARNPAPTGFGLSPTEACSARMPRFIGVVTEARIEIRETTRVAPTLRPPELRTLPRSRPWTVRQVSLSEHERSSENQPSRALELMTGIGRSRMHKLQSIDVTAASW